MEVDTAVKITEDQIDDLIYFARTNDLDAFSELLNDELSGQQQEQRVGPADVLAAAVEQPSGNTPLHMAAANGHEEIIRHMLSILLHGKKSPTSTESAPSTTNSGAAPPSSTSQLPQSSSSASSSAHMSTSNTTTTTTIAPATATPSSLPTPSPLPESHPINHQNASGNTALHWASLNGHLSCTRLLADAGADLSLENDARHDALEEAERAGRTDVARFLLARMSGKTEGEIVEAGAEGQNGNAEGGEETGEEGGGVRVTQEQLERLGLEEKGKEKEREGVNG